VVAPILTSDEPWQWVKEPVLSWIGRNSEGKRLEGRRGGSCFRWAWRRALGEIRGIAEAGTELFEVGGRSTEGIAAVKQ
jgi:hypothetical protein